MKWLKLGSGFFLISCPAGPICKETLSVWSVLFSSTENIFNKVIYLVHRRTIFNEEGLTHDSSVITCLMSRISWIQVHLMHVRTVFHTVRKSMPHTAAPPFDSRAPSNWRHPMILAGRLAFRVAIWIPPVRINEVDRARIFSLLISLSSHTLEALESLAPGAKLAWGAKPPQFSPG
jgi:hypothetical protein